MNKTIFYCSHFLLVFLVGCGFETTRGPSADASRKMDSVFRVDSLALVTLYDSCDGAHWKRHDGWCTEEPLRNWYGVDYGYTQTGRVRVLKLYSNNLSGHLPSAIGDLADLFYLDLDSNHLTGIIPNSLGHLAHLSELNLCLNQLSGPVPDFLGRLDSLESIELEHNQLTGRLPARLERLARSGGLFAAGNKFTP